MFEFHGWASISYHTHDTDLRAQERCWQDVVACVRRQESSLFTTRQANGLHEVTVAGRHARRSEYVIDLFKELAVLAPGSYGILYVRDDEDQRGAGAYANAFRVWKLCRGTLTEE